MTRLSATATPEHIAPTLGRVITEFHRQAFISMHRNAGLDVPARLLTGRVEDRQLNRSDRDAESFMEGVG